jgi:pSer/pThr/pTyr-binding forkhead associated (FHA) protein
MPKMIVSIDGVVIKEVQLTKDRTTLGRRPYNDIVIDNLAVSGEHAVMQMSGNDVTLEDLNSTNGTYVNGKAIKKQALQNGDTVEIGKYKIKFVHEGASDNYEKTMVINSGAVVGGAASSAPPAAPSTATAAIKVLSGAAAGREVPLVKVVTTIGKPGVAVAAITRRPHGYVVALVEGTAKPTVNDKVLGTDAIELRDGDVIELAGTRMQFVQH